jgi:hypothetical protein
MWYVFHSQSLLYLLYLTTHLLYDILAYDVLTVSLVVVWYSSHTMGSWGIYRFILSSAAVVV